jgi:hypothetical protein
MHAYMQYVACLSTFNLIVLTPTYVCLHLQFCGSKALTQQGYCFALLGQMGPCTSNADCLDSGLLKKAPCCSTVELSIPTYCTSPKAPAAIIIGARSTSQCIDTSPCPVSDRLVLSSTESTLHSRFNKLPQTTNEHIKLRHTEDSRTLSKLRLVFVHVSELLSSTMT